MQYASTTNRSNIVLALDFPYEKPENRRTLLRRARHVLESASPYICAVKLNHHLILPFGTFNGVQSLIEKAHNLNLITIMDCKVNDIGATNQTIAEYYYSAGFDALIANPFIGWEEGLKPIFGTAHRQQRGVILLAYMSHKAANEGYGQTIYDLATNEKTPQYIAFAKKALTYHADGVVVGATYPGKIREIYEILRTEIPIFTPGIGTQGGEIQAAIRAGARYVIVGRSIVQASDPAEAAKRILETAKT
jgi:orotidine-5'-phosphate decarboxylase